MKRVLLVACFFCSLIKLSAQQDTLVDKMLVRHNQVVLCNKGFICNNRIYPFIELQNKLLANPEAFKEYQKFQSSKFFDVFPGCLILAGLIGGVATLNSDNNLSGKIILGSISAAMLTIPFHHRDKHLAKALEIYNKQF